MQVLQQSGAVRLVGRSGLLKFVLSRLDELQAQYPARGGGGDPGVRGRGAAAAATDAPASGPARTPTGGFVGAAAKLLATELDEQLRQEQRAEQRAKTRRSQGRHR